MRHMLPIFIFLAAAPFSAIACSCVAPGTVQQEMADSSRVFLGQVSAIQDKTARAENSWFSALTTWIDQLFGEAPVSGRDYPHRQISFAVNQTFKGTSVSVVHLATGFGGGDCGYAFEFGQEYVVYARGKDDALEASICSLTGPASDPRSGLAVLRSGS